MPALVDLIVFNYKYGSYLVPYIPKISSFYNNIYIYDDGSSQSEILQLYSLTNSNIHLWRRTDEFFVALAGNEKIPSHGQIFALSYYYHLFNLGLIDATFAHLLDADDYIYSTHCTDLFVNLDGNASINFLHPINVKNNVMSNYAISRLLPSSHLWPSVCPTSCLIIKTTDFIDYLPFLTSLNPFFDDVWLDSRIQIVCNLKSLAVNYLDIILARRIHNANDSLNMSLSRFLLKQFTHSLFSVRLLNNKNLTAKRCILLLRNCIFAPLLLLFTMFFEKSFRIR